jgi:F5/8 type C domain
VSSNAVEPGTRLVDRYRLEHPLGEAESTTYWRAQDELLDRPVGVCLLSATDRQAERVLKAARRAAALTDGRFLRVLDASEVDGVVYVVSEWVSATNLVDLLADGPLQPAEARDLGLEIAEALAAARRAGLAHLCLQPEHVLRTAHGQVKIGGLAVDAAARGIEYPSAADAARRDARDAAAIVYAAVTGRWPGTDQTGLPAAPRDGDHACTPRQVRAGVPHDLDDVVSRALGLPGSHGAAVTSPDDLAAALAEVQVSGRTTVLPLPGNGSGRPAYSPATLPADDQDPVERSRTAMLAWAAAVLVLAVGFALAGSQLLTGGLPGGDPGADASDSTTSQSPGASGAPTGAELEVSRVSSFDPPPDGTGDENEYAANLAVDGDRNTAWSTKTYLDPFGPSGIKDGVGLVLDLGSRQEIGSVTVRTVGATDFEVRTADSKGTELADYQPLDQDREVRNATRAVVVPPEPVRARYVLIWLTSLPVVDGGYRGEVAEVTARG